jgi:hypothetical protein
MRRLALAALAIGCGGSAPAKTAAPREGSHVEPKSGPATPYCEEEPPDTTPPRPCPPSTNAKLTSKGEVHADGPTSKTPPEDQSAVDELQKLLYACFDTCWGCDAGVKLDFVVLEDGSTCNVTVETIEPPDRAACVRGEILRHRFQGPKRPFRIEAKIALEKTDCSDKD